MNSLDLRIRPDDDRGLVTSVRQLASDIVDYGEARFRLIQAELKVSALRFGKSIVAGGIALLLAVLGYLPLMALAAVYLSENWFGGSYTVPLAILTAFHFGIAALFTLLAWKHWKMAQALTKSDACETEPRSK